MKVHRYCAAVTAIYLQSSFHLTLTLYLLNDLLFLTPFQPLETIILLSVSMNLELIQYFLRVTGLFHLA